jgi:fermentation-respiration switch protein FrsA (DUF1100 family)
MRGLLIALVCACELCACTGLIFHPMRELQLTPAAIGLRYRDLSIVTTDGVRLHAWYLPAQGERRGSVLYLHGNAENISTHIAAVRWLPAAGYSVLLFDYRGYGRSQGTPTLAGVHLDSDAALHRLLHMPKAAGAPIIVFGQSIGGAIAISMLRRSSAACAVDELVVEGAPSGYRAIAREKLASTWLTWPLQVPLSWIINDDFKPVHDIAQLGTMRKLLIGSTGDKVVPINHARALFTAASDPKTLWEVPDLPHTSTFALPRYRSALVTWLSQETGAEQLGSCKSRSSATPQTSGPGKRSRLPRTKGISEADGLAWAA